MIRANRVGGGRAAPGGENDGDMMAMLDFAQALHLELAYHVAADGKATVRVRGELDISTADQAYSYLRDVVDSQDGPVMMNLAELTFCDAAGLGVLARVAGHARRAGRSLKLISARPSLVRIMRITGLDEAFPEVRNPTLSMLALPRQAALTVLSRSDRTRAVGRNAASFFLLRRNLLAFARLRAPPEPFGSQEGSCPVGRLASASGTGFWHCPW